MFIAALLTIAKLWKQPRCPTTNEWIKKLWYLYTMEFYAAMKKNKMLSFAGKWMKLNSLAEKTKKSSPSYADIRSRANTNRGLGFDHMIKTTAQKGGMRIGKTPKNLIAFVALNAEKLK
jgi:hypothetical protein